MTKRLISSLLLTLIAIFLIWYGYQEYKKSQAINIMTQTTIES